MKIFLTLTSLKYLVRKNKNQSRLKKILRERERDRERQRESTEEKTDRERAAKTVMV